MSCNLLKYNIKNNLDLDMTFISTIWLLIKEISPFLLLGFLICGFLSIFLTVDTIRKYLGKKSLGSVAAASLFGIPLPLCSCGVIPVSAYLRKHGATKASTSSFLISTPQTGVDSIFITYSLLGPVLAIYRPIVALISGILGGGLSLFFDKEDDNIYDIDCEDDCCNNEKGSSAISRVFNYGFIRLPLDIVNPLIFGLILSGIFSIFIPSNYFETVGAGFSGMMIMLFLGLPTYVCATASVPIAFVLYTKGFSLGAVLVFLMTGPATNITTISVCWKILGKKSTLIYLFTIVVSSIGAGLLLDWSLPNLKLVSSGNEVSHLLSSRMYDLCGIALCVVMINALRIKIFSNSKIINSEDAYTTIKVEGMTCSHCEESLVKTIMKLKGVKNVFADAKKGEVKLALENDVVNHEINDAINQLGFKVIDD